MYKGNGGPWVGGWTGNGTVETVRSNDSSYANKWTLFGLCKSGSDLSLILDGEIVATENTTTTNHNANCTELTIGATDTGAAEWPGSIDEVRIYDYALSEEQILALYHEITPGTDDWDIIWEGTNSGSVCRHYSFDALVTNQSGIPIQNANVKLYDTNDVEIGNYATSTSGTISTQWVKYGHYNPGTETLTMKSPHRVRITSDGYHDYEQYITMDEAKSLEVALLPTSSGTSAGDVLSWCQNNVATISWWEENMALVINTVLFLGLALLALWAYKRRIGWLSVVAGISVMTIATSVIVDSGAAYGFPYVIVGIGVFFVGIMNIRKMA